MSHFFHSQATSEHERKHGSIPISFQMIEEDIYVVFSEMFGKSPGEFHDIWFPDRIHDREPFLFDEVVIKLTNRIQMTVDSLRT